MLYHAYHNICGANYEVSPCGKISACHSISLINQALSIKKNLGMIIKSELFIIRTEQSFYLPVRRDWHEKNRRVPGALLDHSVHRSRIVMTLLLHLHLPSVIAIKSPLVLAPIYLHGKPDIGHVFENSF